MTKIAIGILSLLAILFSQCKSKPAFIKIWIENNSDIHNSLEFITLFEDNIVDRRMVKKDSIADRFLPFKLRLPNSERLVLKFKTTHDNATTCTLKLDSVTANTLVHVNYVEKLFRKGALFNGAVLSNDSTIRKDFYCEVMYRNPAFKEKFR